MQERRRLREQAQWVMKQQQTLCHMIRKMDVWQLEPFRPANKDWALIRPRRKSEGSLMREGILNWEIALPDRRFAPRLRSVEYSRALMSGTFQYKIHPRGYGSTTGMDK